MELLNLAFLGLPMLVAATWWSWRQTRRQASTRSWRLAAIVVGAVSVTVNAVVFYAWAAYAFSIGHAENGSHLRDTLGNMAFPLCLFALATAVVGKGAARIWLALSAIAGMLLWIPVGIL